MDHATPATKRCSRCAEELPRTAFNANRRDRTGLTSRCRHCDSEYKKEHRAKYPERHKAADLARYQRDHAKRLAAMREYHHRPAIRERRIVQGRARYWADPEATRVRARAYRKANPEAVRRWKRAEYERNGEKIRAAMRDCYAANREQWKAAVLTYARANPEMVNERNRRYRARKKNATLGVVTPALLEAKLAYWGHACWMCGADPNTWDHVKPLNKGGAHMLSNLRPACWSCNSSKSDRWPFQTVRPGSVHASASTGG